MTKPARLLCRLEMPRRPFLSSPTDWFDDAACRGESTDVFFPVSDAHADAAKEICATCPARDACLEFALENRPTDGVWGGATPMERHRIIRRRQKAARKDRGAAA